PNQDQLHPPGRLEVDATTQVDPAPATHHLGPDDQHRDQRQHSYPVRPGRNVHEAVVVDHRDHEHQHYTDHQKLDLLVIETPEFRVQGRRLDLQYTDDRHQQYQR